VFNADPFESFEKGLTQPLTVVCIVKTREAKKGALGFPLRWCRLLDPMASNRKIAIGIAGLPRVTC
jgi:hypothetical protein